MTMAHIGAKMLVTGCNRGIGLELVKQFAGLRNPPSVIYATCRNPEEATDLNKLSDRYDFVKVSKLDITSNADRLSAAKEIKKLDILVNNAGIVDPTTVTLDSVTEESMFQTYLVNTVGPLMLVKAFLPQLKKSGKSKERQTAIVNMSSMAASIDDNTTGRMYPYRCSKVALNMMTRTLNCDLRDDNIVSVAVHTGWVKTRMGGPNAPITAEDCISGVIDNIFGQLSMKIGGRFISYDGRSPRW